MLKGRQREIEVEAGQLARILGQGDSLVEFLDIGTQYFRTHAKKYPVDLIRKRPDNTQHQLQITTMARATRPAHPRSCACLAMAGEARPQRSSQHVRNDANVVVQMRQSVCQWLSGHDQPIA
ncbi:hypothetical protein D3C81_1804520 [compost metagenome]